MCRNRICQKCVNANRCQFDRNERSYVLSGDLFDGRAKRHHPKRRHDETWCLPLQFQLNSKVRSIYGTETISERHRHQYEFNNAYLETFEANGMKATGINPQNNLVKIVQVPGHRWFIGTQFHPELQSTVLKPHPLFVDFIKNAIEFKADKKNQ